MSDETKSDDPVVGRPTLYNPSFCQIAADLCIAGATDYEVARELKCDVRSIYRWKAKYPEFSQALKVGKELADDRVEASLFHRAVGYTRAAVKIMQNNGVPLIVPYEEHHAPDVGAITMWLTNRRADEWRSKQSLEHTGKDGTPIQYEETTRERNIAAIEQLSARLSGATLGEAPACAEGTTDAEPIPGATA